MLEYAAIFNKGGVVLWSHEPKPLEGDPIGSWIQEVLLEERKSQNSYNYQNYAIKWGFVNNLDLIFVVVYLNFAQLSWVDDLIEACKNEFVNLYGPERITNVQESYDFDPHYKKILTLIESRANAGKMHLKPAAAAIGSKPVGVTPVAVPEADSGVPVESKAAGSDNPESPSAGRTPSPASPSAASPIPIFTRGPSTGAKFSEAFAAKLAAKKAQKNPGAANAESDKKSGKHKTEGRRLSQAELAALDMAGTTGSPGGLDHVGSVRSVLGPAPELGQTSYVDDEASEDEEKLDDDELIARLTRGSDDKKSDTGSVWGFFKGLVGQKELTEEDLKPVAQSFTDLLIRKNVASDIAEKLVDSVVASLVGKKVGTFGTMYQTVKVGLEEALTRILTPKKPIDVLSGVMAAKEAGRPYTITFCGVNGVGKSTSLAKVAAYFRSHGYKVGVAACDTFRSGAIEQLKTHCTALNLPLFQSGYGREEAQVAADAIQQARKQGLDVLLIDTAGRMQGNESLMKGLARLISVNDPDLVLFVGEALVGGDGCDQLINFNRALKINSDRAHPRLIDGILLTKFDTIDDKVGAAISMVYSTGQPILFLGVGQTYADLKRPNAKMLVKALLS